MLGLSVGSTSSNRLNRGCRSIAEFQNGAAKPRRARELRVKESDRIAAVASNLRAMGARVEEREDRIAE
jgi:5-enolpyruvylshikimate-3-phosphate synthase